MAPEEDRGDRGGMTMYYAVFYSTDGTIHMWPGKTWALTKEELE